MANSFGSIRQRPDWPERDRFILSKGTPVPLSMRCSRRAGFLSSSDLETFYQNGSPLAGHATHKGVPGVEISSGSLGHGLPMATGMALAAKRDRAGPPDLLHAERRRVRRRIRPGRRRCSRLTTSWTTSSSSSTTTRSRASAASRTSSTWSRCADKWQAFGWGVREIDGHDHEADRERVCGGAVRAG